MGWRNLRINLLTWSLFSGYDLSVMTDGESKKATDPNRSDATESSDDETTAAKAGSVDPSGENSEDQMAQWEEALKNDDWGHQPC